MIQRWYKDAVIYSLDVETFRDSDGNGVGDFRGLASSLDYLAGLGITCIWLLPFYPSPNRDNGYDVADYYGVDPRLGTLGDFVEFTYAARERGIRVIVDLVVNHTSDQHPWFQAALKDRNSKYFDYYVWSDEKPADMHKGMVFPGEQESTWTYAQSVDAYYMHQFYKFQPDLNIANPAVREEIERIMGFWLQLGVSGFRIDAAPFLIQVEKDDGRKSAERYAYLSRMREFLSWRRGDAILLAEANVAPKLIDDYFGDGDRMHMLFNFIVNQHLFLAIATERPEPLTQAYEELPKIPPSAQWANFVRNHDELALGRLNRKEQDAIIGALNVTREMFLYNRGPARRLPPMLNGDQRRIEMVYSLMFSLPGTPVLRYGEEIGMGDDLSLEGRNSVRTPMQWSDEPNGGFSTAPANQLVRPVIDEGPFSYKRVNVAEQQRDPESLLNRIEQMIRARRRCAAFGWGTWQVLKTNEPAVLAHRCDWQGESVVAVHNLSEETCSVTLDFGDETRLFDLLGDRVYASAENGQHTIELQSYGYRWFRLGTQR